MVKYGITNHLIDYFAIKITFVEVIWQEKMPEMLEGEKNQEKYNIKLWMLFM